MIDLSSSINLSKSALAAKAGKMSPSSNLKENKVPEAKFKDALDQQDIKSSTSVDSRPTQTDERKTRAKNSDDVVRPENSEKELESEKVTRKSAMELFLNRMQSDLGVKPEALVNAFSNLSSEDLLAPPTESAEHFVAQLGLSPEKSAKALDLYNEMLAMTAAAGLSQYLNQNNQSAQIKVIDQKEASLQNLKSGLKDMSDRFFNNGDYASQKPGKDISNPNSTKNSNVNEDQNLSTQKEAGAAAFGAGTIDGEISSAEPNLESAINVAPENSGATEVVAKDSSSFSKVDGLSIDGMTPINTDVMNASSLPSVTSENIANLQPAVDSGAQVQPLSITPNPMLSMNSNNAEVPDFSTEEASVDGIDEVSSSQNVLSAEASEGVAQANSKNMNVQNAAGKNKNDKDSDKDENKNEIDADKIIGRAQDQVKNISHKSFAIETPKATAADMQANVKEIITQAQFLAKKGGGEMKVALNPDGMGEVNLKVKMTDGRLSVEMVTSNTEAKHLLERGLGDLKDSLAIHKLHLESVKIDSPKDLSQHMDQKQDGDKGFQQKFLNDFMDQNSGFRRDMMEFGSPTRPESQRREYYSAGYGNSTSKKSDSNRRLDLVA